MTLSFPRPLPDDGAASQTFELDRVDYLSPETGGRLGGVSAGLPLWRGTWVFSRVRRKTSEAWRALIPSLRGAQRTFYGRDYSRPLPAAYPDGFGGLTRAGGGAFDGTAASWSVNGTRDIVTLTGLPAGFVVTLTDYLMLRWTTGGQQRRSLHRAVEAAIGNGSGVTAFAVEPPVPALVPAGAVADFLEPVCIMKAVPGDTRIGAVDRMGKVEGQLTGLQELRP